MKNILIIEEDDNSREKLAEELQKANEYNFVLAADGVTAYQKCRNQEFAVILTSYTTKKLTGKALIEAIRDNNINSYVHIIIYTEDVQKAKVECQDYRNIEYIQKPTDYDVISDKISKLANTNPKRKQFKLDVDFINPFIDSVVETLNIMCGVNDIKAEPPNLLEEDQELDLQVSGSIELSSPFFKGHVAISFKQEVYEGMLQKMLELKEDETIKNDDGAAEILNVIYGRSRVILNDYGYKLERGIPKVIRGENHKIAPNSKIPTLLVPFKSNAGEFYIQICVKAI
jgi:chemotaxis protein CheX